MLNCNNCKRNLNNSKLENYQKEKDLLICAQCWGQEQEKYKNYEVRHFALYKRSGEVDGSSEVIVVWDWRKIN